MNVNELINIGSLKLKSKNIKTHKIDSEVIMMKVLNKKRENIFIDQYQNIKEENISKFHNLIERRLNNEPIAYILNEKEFWSMNFKVNKNALIPRPETELMVEKLVKIYKNKNIRILDIGTGSGCILISLLSELKKSRGVAIDISRKALNVAIENAKLHNMYGKIKFFKKPLDAVFNEKFDLIVSNPPYINSLEIKNLQDDVKKFEPKIALDGGNDGLDLIKKVIYKAKYILKINGSLALEIGNGQTKRVSKILISNNFKIENRISDFKDNIRCIISRLKRN